MDELIQKIALIAAVVLPLWNLPLIVRIIKRRSSQDISIYWAIGVWICLALMAPAGFISKDPVWRIFNIVNLSIFSLVVFVIIFYRKRN